MTEKEVVEKLKPKLKDEFLSTLVDLVKMVGWRVDYTELESFVSDVYRIVNKKVPDDLRPFCDVEGDWYDSDG